MRTDVMSGSGLAAFAELAMILFFLAFVAIAVWIWLPRNRKTWEAASRMPLDDVHPQEPRTDAVEPR
jgi:cbb3-type cytochrome oxidase subunit 3